MDVELHELARQLLWQKWAELESQGRLEPLRRHIQQIPPPVRRREHMPAGTPMPDPAPLPAEPVPQAAEPQPTGATNGRFLNGPTHSIYGARDEQRDWML